MSIFEQIANGMIVAGALAQGNTSGSLNQAGGHRNGMPGGQNVGGFSFPLLQAGVATFQLFSAAGAKPKDFIDFVNAASKKGRRTWARVLGDEGKVNVDLLGSVESVNNEKGDRVEKRSYGPLGRSRSHDARSFTNDRSNYVWHPLRWITFAKLNLHRTTPCPIRPFM